MILCLKVIEAGLETIEAHLDKAQDPGEGLITLHPVGVAVNVHAQGVAAGELAGAMEVLEEVQAALVGKPIPFFSIPLILARSAGSLKTLALAF